MIRIKAFNSCDTGLGQKPAKKSFFLHYWVKLWLWQEGERGGENSLYSWAERRLLRSQCRAILTTDLPTLHTWLTMVFRSKEDGYQPPGTSTVQTVPLLYLLYLPTYRTSTVPRPHHGISHIPWSIQVHPNYLDCSVPCTAHCIF